MTPEQLAKLTQKEKRVKIAEVCGVKCERCKGAGEYLRYGSHAWFRIRFQDGDKGEQQPVKCDHVTADYRKPGRLLPDYPNDLNAMHEAIMAQTPTFRKAMRLWLYELTDQMSAHFADAPTMADAFLLTL